MTRWEYKLERRDEPSIYSFEKTLNYYGDDGWEVFHIERTQNSAIFWMKRPQPVPDKSEDR